mmetsp:Transcript_142954/g.372368  ORF Transcript_142954/g.372368 Transcript_142954/m.372368 type:complete len:333 (+) Transcript_142954:1027-2025(+)
MGHDARLRLHDLLHVGQLLLHLLPVSLRTRKLLQLLVPPLEHLRECLQAICLLGDLAVLRPELPVKRLNGPLPLDVLRPGRRRLQRRQEPGAVAGDSSRGRGRVAARLEQAVDLGLLLLELPGQRVDRRCLVLDRLLLGGDAVLGLRCQLLPLSLRGRLLLRELLLQLLDAPLPVLGVGCGLREARTPPGLILVLLRSVLELGLQLERLCAEVALRAQLPFHLVRPLRDLLLQDPDLVPQDIHLGLRLRRLALRLPHCLRELVQVLVAALQKQLQPDHLSLRRLPGATDAASARHLLAEALNQPLLLLDLVSELGLHAVARLRRCRLCKLTL